ncbi:MAG TPA: TIGR02996 domain-containing protein [Gemmata sp.]
MTRRNTLDLVLLPEYRAFIQAILKDVADDTPRLVMADWLEENGDSDRAELIRIQCEIARMTPFPPIAVYRPSSDPHHFDGADLIFPLSSPFETMGGWAGKSLIDFWMDLYLTEPDGTFVVYSDREFVQELVGAERGIRKRFRPHPRGPYPHRARFEELRRRERTLLATDANVWVGEDPGTYLLHPIQPGVLTRTPFGPAEIVFERGFPRPADPSPGDSASAAEDLRDMELPDQMPDGCNFYGLLRTALTPAAVAQRFTAAGWTAAQADGREWLTVAWGTLSLSPGSPIEVRGGLDRPDDRVGELLGLLGGREIDGVYQWINAEGRLWRELPFDESMLAPDDPRLPPDIKASILAGRGGAKPAPVPRKPWWRFW